MKGRITRREFGLLAAATGATAASGGVHKAHAQQGILKLGVLLPRSGFQAAIGQGCQRGFDVAVKILREQGHQIELLNGDTESNSETARTQAQRLIRDGAHIITGAFDSGATAVAAQVCEQNGIPFVINIGADPAITEQGYKFVFRNFPTSVMLGSGSLRLMGELFSATKTAPKTAVLMIINDTFGQGMLRGINALFPKAGLPFEIVKTITYDAQAKDLSVEIAQAKAVNADLHLAVTRLNDAILMIREMIKQRYEPMAVISPGAPGFYERQFIKNLGKYAEYNYSINAWMDPKQPLTARLESAFYKDFPDDSFDLNIGFSLEAAMIAADAYRRAGSTTPQAIAEALRATSITQRVMVGGPIRFNEKGQNTDTEMAVLQIRDGKPKVVLPASSAELSPILPMPSWSKRG